MKRVSFKEPITLIFGVILAVLSAAICMQIMGQLGTAPNTSLIGAVLIMIVAKIPLGMVRLLKNVERQNYVLSIASSAGFTAANCGFVAIATVFIMGRNDLIVPISFGVLFGSMIAVFAMGRLFDTKVFPARGAWPMGVAVATALQAGDEGGKKGWQLLQGLVFGAVLSFFGIPAAGIGIAFIANMLTMVALGIGMILRGYSQYIFGGFDIGQSNIAQGIMIGAGVVALIQIIRVIKNPNKAERDYKNIGNDRETRKALIGSVGLFVIGAVLVALITGAFSDMGIGMSVLWVVFAGVTAVVTMVLTGTASMHSGWGPAFAVVTICLTIGMLIGFSPVALAVLVGYIGAVGMPFADTGIGLKAGWIIRGEGVDPENERYGRRQQVIIKQFGVVIGVGMAVVFGVMLANNDILPPMSVFYASKTASTVSPELIWELVIWAIPGAILQLVFGNKSVGLMLATGLLINNPIFGITLLAAIGLRLIIGTKHTAVRAPGLIAGDGLFGFGANIFRAFF
ncbi:MAG: OPT/YSL family transporter [Defluviitaleaceae bacterium]|nr:OPT/YSL family transporter [Defluviitaleaceae bacterium]